MFNIDRRKFNKIMLTRGDSASICIEVVDLEGNKYEIKPSDTIKFSVVQPSTGEVVIEKIASPEHYIVLAPADTSNLEVGLYQYDVQLTTGNGNIYTIIVPSIFELTNEVTR